VRVGILGGVFNPPHIGHLVCAQEAHAQLALGVVVFVPCGVAPHREIEQDPGADVRVDLCQRAIGSDDRLAVSDVEAERRDPSYTVDTLRLLREQSPEDDLVLILGGDQAAALPSWREPEEVLRLATVAAVERAGRREQGIAEQAAEVEGADRVVFFDMPRIDVSSTLVRARVATGRPIRYLVPDAVADVIADRELYRV